MPENLHRVGFLVVLPRLLRRFGVDPVAVLKDAGLPAQALDDQESTVPYLSVGQLLRIAVERTGCPHLGLEIGRGVGTKGLGLIGALMRNAPTVGAALLDFAGHQHRNSHGAVVYLLSDSHQVFFGYAVYQADIPGIPVISDIVTTVGFNIVTELASGRGGPIEEVLLSRSEPANFVPYQDLFGPKLRFNSDQMALRLSPNLLDRPVAGADAALRATLEKRVRDLWYSGTLDIVTQLRRALRVALLSGRVSADEVSGQMGMSRRTLHRRLEAYGLKFQQVLDETRCEFAQQLLSNTLLSISQVGVIVGYEDPSVFTRGFTRWAGAPPSAWRASLAMHAPA